MANYYPSNLEMDKMYQQHFMEQQYLSNQLQNAYNQPPGSSAVQQFTNHTAIDHLFRDR